MMSVQNNGQGQSGTMDGVDHIDGTILRSGKVREIFEVLLGVYVSCSSVTHGDNTWYFGLSLTGTWRSRVTDYSAITPLISIYISFGLHAR